MKIVILTTHPIIPLPILDSSGLRRYKNMKTHYQDVNCRPTSWTKQSKMRLATVLNNSDWALTHFGLKWRHFIEAENKLEHHIATLSDRFLISSNISFFIRRCIKHKKTLSYEKILDTKRASSSGGSRVTTCALVYTDGLGCCTFWVLMQTLMTRWSLKISRRVFCFESNACWMVTQPEITKHENEYHLKSVSQVAVSLPKPERPAHIEDEANHPDPDHFKLFLEWSKKCVKKMRPEDIRSSSSSWKRLQISWTHAHLLENTNSKKPHHYA